MPHFYFMTTPAKKIPQQKKGGRSRFYKISAWLHLWLGLITGIVMMIVCITGCIWVFNEEITAMMEPENNVPYQQQAVLLPSQIMDIAAREYPGKRVSYTMYRQNKALEVNVGGRRGGSTLKLDPYTGRLISKTDRKPGETSFFRWVLNGHRFLWLPYKIGRPIVNYSTLIFVITLFSGLVLWWPKKWNKSAREKSFTIKWGASIKRINYDLHNVLGFYCLLILFAIGVTGMVYGIEWFSKGLYWVTAGGKGMPAEKEVVSDSTQAGKHFTPTRVADIAWQEVARKHPAANGFYMSFPDTSEPASTITVVPYPNKGQYISSGSYQFDQHTGKQLPADAVYGTALKEASFAVKLRRMNYDIHVGSILGLPGKFLAFFASLIGATLPVTGFIIWWGKKKKKPVKKKPARVAEAIMN